MNIVKVNEIYFCDIYLTVISCFHELFCFGFFPPHICFFPAISPKAIISKFINWKTQKETESKRKKLQGGTRDENDGKRRNINTDFILQRDNGHLCGGGLIVSADHLQLFSVKLTSTVAHYREIYHQCSLFLYRVYVRGFRGFTPILTFQKTFFTLFL